MQNAKLFARSLKQRFSHPATVFLIFTIILSTVIFVLSLKSGVPKFTLPALTELTSSNVNSLEPIYQIESGVGLTNVRFSPDGKFLAVARLDKTLHIWSTKDYHLIYTFPIEPECGDCVAFSPDSHFVAAVREEHPNDMIVWDLETGKSSWESMGELVEKDEKISSLVFSPDGKLLAEAIGTRVLFWMLDDTGFVLVREIMGHAALVESLAFNPDGRRLLTTSADMTAKVWDSATGTWLMTLSGHSDIIVTGIFTPDDVWIVTAGYDQTIRFWDSRNGTLAKTLTVHTSPVISLVSSPNSQLIASSGVDDHVILWDVITKNPLLILPVHREDIIPMAFSPDNKIFASITPDGTLQMWGVEK